MSSVSVTQLNDYAGLLSAAAVKYIPGGGQQLQRNSEDSLDRDRQIPMSWSNVTGR